MNKIYDDNGKLLAVRSSKFMARIAIPFNTVKSFGLALIIAQEQSSKGFLTYIEHDKNYTIWIGKSRKIRNPYSHRAKADRARKLAASRDWTGVLTVRKWREMAGASGISRENQDKALKLMKTALIEVKGNRAKAIEWLENYSARLGGQNVWAVRARIGAHLLGSLGKVLKNPIVSQLTFRKLRIGDKFYFRYDSKPYDYVKTGSRTYAKEIDRQRLGPKETVNSVDSPVMYQGRHELLKNPGIKHHRVLAKGWTGSKADFVSRPGHYGTVGGSELALSTGHAGKEVIQYALFSAKDRKPWVTWAQVRMSDGRILDGLPGEVLPAQVRRDLGGFGKEKIPSHNWEGKLLKNPPFRKIVQSDVEAAQRGLNMVSMSISDLKDLIKHHEKIDMFASKVIVVGARQMLAAKRRMGALKNPSSYHKTIWRRDDEQAEAWHDGTIMFYDKYGDMKTVKYKDEKTAIAWLASAGFVSPQVKTPDSFYIKGRRFQAPKWENPPRITKRLNLRIGDAVDFHMTNLPGSPWKVYYVLRISKNSIVFSSFHPRYLQYNAEHVEYTPQEFLDAVHSGHASRTIKP